MLQTNDLYFIYMKASQKYLGIGIIIISLALSTLLFRSEVSYNSSACISASACEETVLGTKTVKWLGFPAHYNIQVDFSPNDHTNQGFVNQGGDTQYNMILINTIFWAFAIHGCSRIILSIIKNNKQKK